MGIQIGQRADHGFDEPLGLLSDCHRRIERFLRAMLAVARANDGGPLPADHQEVLRQGLRYFSTAAPRHTADEERSLFPRLKASADPAARDVLEKAAALEADHRVAEQLHAEVDSLCHRWLDDGRLPGEDVARLRGDLEKLDAAYARHIGIEDNEVFPAAGRILGAREIEEIGREMADRRGVPFRTAG